VLTGSGWLIAVSRVENILIGVAIAALASCLLFPTWLRTSMPGLVASAIKAIGRYLALVREVRGAGAQARLLHEARSDAETAVASLRAAAGQLGLEPGSGAVAMAGDVSAAAARVLDVIIALQVMLHQPGSGQSAGVTAIMGEAGDALRRMRAAIAGQERPVPVAVLAGTGHRQGQAGALTTAAAPARATIAAAVTRAGSRGESSPCAPVPESALLSAALDQLTDAVADLGSALGRLPGPSKLS